jgi:nitrogen-specific signal transduction histidine kinase
LFDVKFSVIGLSIVKLLVDAHEGKIVLEDNAAKVEQSLLLK